MLEEKLYIFCFPYNIFYNKKLVINLLYYFYPSHQLVNSILEQHIYQEKYHYKFTTPFGKAAYFCQLQNLTTLGIKKKTIWTRSVHLYQRTLQHRILPASYYIRYL